MADYPIQTKIQLQSLAQILGFVAAFIQDYNHLLLAIKTEIRMCTEFIIQLLSKHRRHKNPFFVNIQNPLLFWHYIVVEYYTEFDTKVKLPWRYRLLIELYIEVNKQFYPKVDTSMVTQFLYRNLHQIRSHPIDIQVTYHQYFGILRLFRIGTFDMKVCN